MTTCNGHLARFETKGSVKVFQGAGKIGEERGKRPFRIANMGIGYVPENRDIFPRPYQRDKTDAGAEARSKGMVRGRWSMQAMFDMLRKT